MADSVSPPPKITDDGLFVAPDDTTSQFSSSSIIGMINDADVSPPPEVSPNQDPYAQIAELAADRVFTHWRDQLHQMNAHEFELALLTASLDAVSEARPAIFAAGVAAGRTQAARAIRKHTDDDWTSSFHRGMQEAARIAAGLPEGQENT